MIETDADLRNRLLMCLAEVHVEQARRKESINAAE